MMIYKDKTLDRHKTDVGIAIEEEINRQNYNRNNSRETGRQNFRRNFSNDRSGSRERRPTPRRNGNRGYNSPNKNLGD